MPRSPDENRTESGIVLPPGINPPTPRKARLLAKKARKAGGTQAVPASAAVRSMAARIVEGAIPEMIKALEKPVKAMEARLNRIEGRLDRLEKREEPS